jgi:hypothetical protein
MDSGFLMIYRELNNKESSKEFVLPFLKNKNLLLTDIETNESVDFKIANDGKIKVEIIQPAGYKFFKYTVKKEE